MHHREVDALRLAVPDTSLADVEVV